MPHGFAHRSFARRAVLRKGRAARRLRCSGGFDCACCITIRYAGSRVVRGARRREWRRSGNWAFPDGAQAWGAFSSCLRKSCCGPMVVLLRSCCPAAVLPSYRSLTALSSCRLAALPSYRPARSYRPTALLPCPATALLPQSFCSPMAVPTDSKWRKIADVCPPWRSGGTNALRTE